MIGCKYWAPQVVENPELIEDLEKFFFGKIKKSKIESVVNSHKHKLAIICDRYEFVNHLLNLRSIFDAKKQYKNGKMASVVINGTSVLKITREEEIILDSVNFNGITYDIDSLCQYLLLTLIDTIMGKIEYENFVSWLTKNESKKSYSIDELKNLQNTYDDENGLRKNFRKAFNLGVSPQSKKRIIDTFLVAKADLGVINESDLGEWNGLDDNTKYDRIVKYFYDSIRCMYTHNSTRTFLSNTDIGSRQPTKKKILIAKKDPKKDNLIQILQTIVQELIVSKFIEKSI